MPARPRVWLITGTSAGLGLAMTRTVLERGDIAVATLRTPDALKDLAAQHPPDRLLVLKLDVTVHKEIFAAFEKTREVFGRIDVVVNNAGYSMLGEVEGTPDEISRAMFEVNFWGAAHVMQEAVRFFREVNPPGEGGRIIHISSACGMVGYPSTGFYPASKHAMEGLAETLAKELDPVWNIKVTIIPLGGHVTNGVAAMVKLPPHPAYSNPELPTAIARKSLLASLTGEAVGTIYEVKGDVAKAAQALYRVSEMPSPPLRLVLGKDSVQFVREKMASVSAEVEEYASWSDV